MTARSNMFHKRIGLDFDDTLMPTRAAIVDHLNAQHGTAITLDSLTDYRFVDQWGLTELDFITMVNQHEKTFHDRPPLPGVLETLAAWTATSTFHVITGRPTPWIPSAQLWLLRHNIQIATIHSADMEGKARLALAQNITLFIEDNAVAALNLAENGIDVLLLDAPYNRYCSHPRITRVKDWFEIQAITRNGDSRGKSTPLNHLTI